MAGRAGWWDQPWLCHTVDHDREDPFTMPGRLATWKRCWRARQQLPVALGVKKCGGMEGGVIWLNGSKEVVQALGSRCRL